MSLPPGFLDELRNRTSLGRVVGRKVSWDQRKSNQGKGDLWAPCPFHQEKTASFHVDDKQGYYYCFGCHAKGDAISFVRETENVGFMEAIEILAREVGMTMPARDPQAQAKADHRGQLAEVMEQAVQFYRLQLKTAGAAAARDYLERRGLSPETQDRWEIGFAPPGWQGLWDHLAGKSVPEDLVLGAGLAKASDRGKKPYDTFRNRIIFPIRDARGRAIAFGGRAMDPNDNAKYLNSPETELFDKGRSLYNHARAREAAGKGQPLIVAEGYMDVIALSEAGFQATVAPLGTAITEDQLQLLWRIHPEPVIALDGDTAGLRAAMRVIDIALPLLEAGQSVRFCILPQGLDPDDMIRTQGADVMRKLVESAQPMVRLLWQRETEGTQYDSPERRAALDKTLRAAISKIRDPSIRSHYGEEIKRLRWDLFGGSRQGGNRQRSNWRKGPTVLPSTKQSYLAGPPGDAVEERLREAVILATLLVHPSLLTRFESEIEVLDFSDIQYRRLRDSLLRNADAGPAIRIRVEEDCGAQALEKLLGLSHVQIAPAMRHPEDTELATLCLAEDLAKLEARRGVRREIDDAMQDMESVPDEGLTWRLRQAAETRSRAERSQKEDAGNFDVGPNGELVSREERSAFEQLLGRITFTKGKDERT